MKPSEHPSTLSFPVAKRDHIYGPIDAPITLLEYGDYECPHCAAAHPIVLQLQEDVGERLCFAYRHYPLVAIHAYAVRAAEAVEAAGAQGKFWQMHDRLMTTRELADRDLIRHAGALGLNVSQFEKDLKDQKFFPRVQQDFNSGVRSGVLSTPTFFINGVKHIGGYDLQSLMSGLHAMR
jgi:protein-disulfide isomerase